MQRTEHFWQIHLSKPNPCSTVWSRQQVVLASMWTHEMDYMCFNQKEDISILNGGSLKFMDKFTYLGSSISSTENDFNMWLVKAWTVIDRLLIIWKSDLSDKIKCNFFQVTVVSILLYGCTTWMLTKYREKKLERTAQECYKTPAVWTLTSHL